MSDALGNLTAITNASGTMEERYGYEAYGTPRFMNASFGSISSSAYDWNVLYASYKWDEETGYYQVRNRYLHPGLGRWLTRDPIGYDGGVNLYAYVGNRPVNEVDPSGEGVGDCIKAMAKLQLATARLNLRLAEAVIDIKKTGLDRKHQKSISEAVTQVNEAMRNVIKFCGPCGVAAIVIAAAVDAIVDATAVLLAAAALAAAAA
jgi:RHS repeat-associated protein